MKHLLTTIALIGFIFNATAQNKKPEVTLSLGGNYAQFSNGTVLLKNANVLPQARLGIQFKKFGWNAELGKVRLDYNLFNQADQFIMNTIADKVGSGSWKGINLLTGPTISMVSNKAFRMNVNALGGITSLSEVPNLVYQDKVDATIIYESITSINPAKPQLTFKPSVDFQYFPNNGMIGIEGNIGYVLQPGASYQATSSAADFGTIANFTDNATDLRSQLTNFSVQNQALTPSFNNINAAAGLIIRLGGDRPKRTEAN